MGEPSSTIDPLSMKITRLATCCANLISCVTMSTVILLGGAARIAGYARMGFYEGSSVILIAIGLPLVLIGSWLGDRVIRRLDPRMFGRLVGGLILLSGVTLLVR